jgi:hypothetical protein
VGEHFVYLYRTPGGAPKYVGYGHHLARALSHAEHSHNERLREWLSAGRFDLTVSGPYRDEDEAKAVEAALISALRPEFNKAPGDGPRFLPVGVPPALAERTAMPALAEGELGVLTGGALVVYLAPGDFLSDGRRKYDAADPRDADVLSNMRGYWDLGKHLSEWAANPGAAPRVLIGVHGRNVAHRFIVGAAAIDTAEWSDAEMFVRAGAVGKSHCASRSTWMRRISAAGAWRACDSGSSAGNSTSGSIRAASRCTRRHQGRRGGRGSVSARVRQAWLRPAVWCNSRA